MGLSPDHLSRHSRLFTSLGVANEQIIPPDF